MVYDCASHSYCTRAAGPVGGALGAAEPLIDSSVTIANPSNVFRVSTAPASGLSPTYIYVALDQTLGKPFKNSMEFQDGIALRDGTSP